MTSADRAARGTIGPMRFGVIALALCVVAVCALPATSSATRYSRTRKHPSIPLCPPGPKVKVRCQSLIVPTVTTRSPASVGPAYEGSGEEGGYDPANLYSAYKLSGVGGSGQTVAIVDALDDPKAESDLKTYRSHYGLSECTTANGCFKKVNQRGETSEAKLPSPDEHWAGEISLDLDMVSAICPECHILLVEADEPNIPDLAAGVKEAVTLGATEVSNSYGQAETAKANFSAYDSNYEQAGIPITVSAGDSGYGPNYPATAPTVIAVGGTALKKEAKSTRGWTEEVWRNTEYEVGEERAGTGSGCSLFETKPSWQHDAGCPKNRTVSDVAAVASGTTPVSVYDTYAKKGGWLDFEGTSVGAPIVAAAEAQASAGARADGAELFYRQPGITFDVTTGSNGSCGGSYLCTAGVGYDGPTGMGSLNGVPRILHAAEGTSPAVVRDAGTGNQWIYYVNSNHEVAFWSFTVAEGWRAGVLGGKVASGSSLAVARSAGSGDQFVYYVNSSNNAVWFWGYNAAAGAWSDQELGGKVAGGTTPAVVRNESTGDQFVYYVNSSNSAISTWNFNYSATKWSNAELGGKAAAGTSPTVVRSASSGDQFVYYVNSSNSAISTWNYNAAAAKWSNGELGGKAATGTSPTVLRNESTGDQFLYYVNSSNSAISTWNFNFAAAKWSNAELGGKAATGTSPTVVRSASSGDQFVYYVNSSNGAISTWNFNYSATKWSNAELGGKAAAGTSPTVVRSASSGDQFLYYVNNANEEIWTWNFNSAGAKWSDAEL